MPYFLRPKELKSSSTILARPLMRQFPTLKQMVAKLFHISEAFRTGTLERT